MANYARYHQRKRLRDKSSLFFLSSFVLVVVYTSVIGFVLVHVLKITRRVEESNIALEQTNEKLEEKLEGLVHRLEILESKNMSDENVNIVLRNRLKVDKAGRTLDTEIQQTSKKRRQLKQNNSAKVR